MVLSMQVTAQPASDSIHYSPRTVIYNHLAYLQKDSFKPKQAALSFPGSDLERNVTLTRQLKQILDGKGLYVDINAVPDKRVLSDSLSDHDTYILFQSDPLIYVERTPNGWYYSRTTVKNIPRIHKEVYPFGTGFMEQFLNPGWSVQFLGIQVWQWLGMLILLVGVIILHQILSILIRLFFNRVVKRRKLDSLEVMGYVRKGARLLSLVVLTRLMIVFFPALLLAPKIAAYFIKGLRIFSIVFLILLLLQAVNILMIYLDKLTKRTENQMDDQLVPVVRRIVKGVVLIGGILFILRLLEVNVTALLAGISIGGLALALAAQDTVKNLIGSLMIFVDRPFQIGDWISFEGVDGTVEEVGIRSTRVRTFANSVTYVPNGKLADLTVNNMGVRHFRRFKTNLGITYDTPPHIIEAFVEGIRGLIIAHPYSRKDTFEVHLNDFGSHSLNILIYMFFAVPSWTDELTGKHELMLSIMKLAETLGVRFAFPTSTLHIEEIPGQPSLTPTHSQDREDIARRLREFLASNEDRLDAKYGVNKHTEGGPVD